MINLRTYVIGGIVVLVIILGAVGAFFLYNANAKQHVATGDPVDITHEFYDSWLKAALSTTTNPYREGLAKSPILSKTLRAQIADAQNSKDTVDPVLCQEGAPAAIAVRTVSQTDAQAELLVTASHSNSTRQADVKLLPLNGGWYINDIQCSAGEFAPEREFTFDTDGSLLKSDVKPLNGKYWYLIFAQDGEQGHYAPLIFSAQSMCTGLDGTTAVCKPDTFVQTAKAHVQGEMTETGVSVKKVTLLK
jgi:hypothetical protein